MQYSFKKIKTVEQCDALLIKVQKKKQNLERRRRRLGESIDAFRGRMYRMNEESEAVRMSIDAFTTAYLTLPEGKYKMDMMVKIKRLEVRQVRLELKGFTYNVTALLVKEMRYNTLDSLVVAAAEYVAAVRYLRMTLGKGALRVNRKNTSSLVQAEGQQNIENAPQAYANPNLTGSMYRELTNLRLLVAGFHQDSAAPRANGVVQAVFEDRIPGRKIKAG